MDKDLEKSLRDLMCESQKLTQQTEELMAQTKALVEQFQERKKDGRKKLGSTRLLLVDLLHNPLRPLNARRDEISRARASFRCA